ncbi:CapA family protein (plasmid) [Deinococcus sp. PESE-38]
MLRGSGLVPVSRQVTWLNVKGAKLALFAYLDDGQTPPPLAEVRRAAAQADLVIVLPHWGAEYNGVTARQRQQARALVDAGAGLVVGSGPHVLQGHEWLGRALVLYSLGNLLFDQPYPATWAGAVVHVTLQQGKLQACTFPTFSRAGRVQPGRPAERTAVQERLGLSLCPASEEKYATI